MPRKRTPYIRPDANRDARLIVIATEDTKAAVKYFKTLVSPAYYQNSKVHVEILARTDTASSPDRVLAQLNDFLPHVEHASLRAEQLDIQPQDRWPQQLGTHVYRLVRSIVDSTSYR